MKSAKAANVAAGQPPGKRAQNGKLLTFRCIFLTMKGKKNAAISRPRVAAMVEEVIGCKWSLTVLSLVRQGVRRPGALEHAVPGLSAKVLNERLKKLTRYGVLQRTSYPEIPPRVEYSLTPFGERFAGILDQIRRLEDELDGE